MDNTSRMEHIGTGPIEARYGGRVYHLSLRTAPDGFIPAWEELAAQVIVEGFALAAGALPDSFFKDGARVSMLLNLVVEEAQPGAGFVVNGERTPIPWRTWDDLGLAALKTIVNAFFFSSLKRIERFAPSTSFMRLPLTTWLNSVSEMVTQATATPASPPPD